LVQTTNQVSLPNLEKELALLEQGYCFIAGLDEAGRGAWAGPVVAAAVILPLHQPDLADQLLGLRDSKLLTPLQREHLFEVIQQVALAVAVGAAPAALVDQLNVVGATRYAMHQAISGLALTPDYLLLDHLRLPALPIPQDAYPKADNSSLTVAAASVMAKVTRDRLMVQYGETYPIYGFKDHKGYGTKAHQEALSCWGPCELHRLSFEPLKGGESVDILQLPDQLSHERGA
jgi:ribonuclease HII